MIALKLYEKIENYCHDLLATHPLIEQAKKSALSPEQFLTYLASVKYLLRQTPEHLRLAQGLASEAGKDALAQFFADKRVEEAGHLNWAEEDLKHSSEQLKAESTEAEPLHEAKALMDYAKSLIDKDPSSYLSYILFAELTTVLCGDVWANAATRSVGLEVDAMSSVVRHVELDKEHVKDDLDVLEELMGQEDHQTLDEALVGSMQKFDEFLNAIHAIH